MCSNTFHALIGTVVFGLADDADEAERWLVAIIGEVVANVRREAGRSDSGAHLGIAQRFLQERT